MDHSDVIEAANELAFAIGSKPYAFVNGGLFRDGSAVESAGFVRDDPTHTDYLWYDGPEGRAGIVESLSVDAEVVACIGGVNIIGTTVPVSLELDPSLSFEWDLIPYDRETASKLVLALWMQSPDERAICAEDDFDDAVWIVEHTGAMDFRIQKITTNGIAGRANLNLLDEENRETVIQQFGLMLRCQFITHETADLLISDRLGDMSYLHDPDGGPEGVPDERGPHH